MMSNLTALLAIAASIWICDPMSAIAQEIRIPELVRSYGPGVVTLRTFDAAGRPLSIGSGFMLEGNLVVTNSHVVEGAAAVSVMTAEGKILGRVTHAAFLDEVTDVAVLRLDRGSGQVLRLANHRPPVGERIVVIGAPAGLSNSVSDGPIAGYRQIDDRELLQITAPISAGSSGGPVLTLDGRVVGVTVGSFEDSQNLNFAVPAEIVEHAIAALTDSVPFPPPRTVNASAPNTTTRDTITVGQLARAILDIADIITPKNTYVDLYVFAASAGDTLVALLMSEDFDSFMFVVGPNGDVVGQDDDSAGGINAKVTWISPTGGTYIIGATSADEFETGEYRLSVEHLRDYVEVGDTAPDFGPRWRTAIASGTQRWLYDTFSVVEVSPDVIQAWSMVYHDPPTITDDRLVDTFLRMSLYDCRNRRAQPIELVLYFQGAVVNRIEQYAPGWDSWKPDSAGEALGEALCRVRR